MNYLETVNLCLQELNFKLVTDFNELVKPDHKRILNLVNRVNDVILNSYDWSFLLRDVGLEIPAGAMFVELPHPMKIKSLICDGQNLRFHDDYTVFLNENGSDKAFSVFDNKLVIKPCPKTRAATVVYLTTDHAVDANGVEIPKLVEESDRSLIPEQHVVNALVYGVCMQYKSNPEHPKFKYWLSMYNSALANLRHEGLCAAYVAPSISIARARFAR